MTKFIQGVELSPIIKNKQNKQTKQAGYEIIK